MVLGGVGTGRWALAAVLLVLSVACGNAFFVLAANFLIFNPFSILKLADKKSRGKALMKSSSSPTM